MSTRIPIFKDDLGFEKRQSDLWDDMQRDMERRKLEWDHEIENMRKEFFTMKPEGKNSRSLFDNPDMVKGVVEKDDMGRPIFRAQFDVHQFKPEEVNVKMDADKIEVRAKHEGIDGASSVSREYSRSLNIPREIDPLNLQCTMSKDGILWVEALLPAPQYAETNDAPRKTEPRIPTPSSASATGSQAQQPPTPPPPPPTPPPRPDAEKKFKLEMEIEDFKPEEINVKTLDKKLVVTARREQKTGSRTSTKEMSREYSIPDNVDPLSVKAFFSDTGKLFVEAPYKAADSSAATPSTFRTESPLTCR